MAEAHGQTCINSTLTPPSPSLFCLDTSTHRLAWLFRGLSCICPPCLSFFPLSARPSPSSSSHHLVDVKAFGRHDHKQSNSPNGMYTRDPVGMSLLAAARRVVCA